MSDDKPKVLTEVSGLERFLHRKMMLVVVEAVPQHTLTRGGQQIVFVDREVTPVILRALRWYSTGAMSCIVQEVETGNMKSVSLSRSGTTVTLLRSDVSDLALLGEEAE
jgi:hypothetical protein